MPTSVGPNTFGEENLVFGYDLGDVSNSYKGEPVTNIWGVQTGFNVNQRSGWDMPYAYNGAITNSVYTGGTWNGNRIWEVLHTAGTSGYAGYESWRLCVDQPLAGTGTYSTTRRVAIKICVLEGSITDMALHSGGGNSSYDGSNWTPIPESQVPRDCPIKTGWYQFLADGSWNSNSVGHCVGLGFISYNRVKILTTEPMYYPSSHLIPFTGYQRSATQGLLDLKRTSTIDLTDVSFNSNAQVVFDGTNDSLVVDNNAVLKNNNTSIEFIIKYLNTPNGDIIQFGVGSGTYAQYYYRAYSGNSYWNFYPAGGDGVGDITIPNAVLPLNQYHHIVMTGDAQGYVQFYINGVAQSGANRSSYSQAANWTPADLTVGGFSWDGYSNSEIPYVKIYNRVLTASEIKSNFNAIKSRFNI